MAVIATPSKVVVNIMLNNGTTATGSIKTIAVRLGGSSQSIDQTVYNTNLSDSRTKVWAIKTALASLFAKQIYSTEELSYSNIENE